MSKDARLLYLAPMILALCFLSWAVVGWSYSEADVQVPYMITQDSDHCMSMNDGLWESVPCPIPLTESVGSLRSTLVEEDWGKLIVLLALMERAKYADITIIEDTGTSDLGRNNLHVTYDSRSTCEEQMEAAMRAMEPFVYRNLVVDGRGWLHFDQGSVAHIENPDRKSVV